MKMLYVAGESANWVIRLCNEFCKLGHEVTCVVQQLDEYDKDNPVIEHEKLTRVNVNYNVMFSPFLLEEELVKRGIMIKYDIIYGSHTPVSPVIYYLGNKYGVPWGIMILDIPVDLIHTDQNRLRNWTYWFDMMKDSKYLTFNTKVARDEHYKLTNNYFDDTHIIIYATHVPNEYQLSGVDIKGDYVVSAFRLTPAKNASMITKALATMDKPLKQVVIGRDRGDLANILQIAKEHNIEVIYKSMVTEQEKFELIKNSFCLIYPQLSEYIGGLSPWEGMFIGKPTLVSDYKVLRNMFAEHAIYFDPTNPQSLADAIQKAYDKSVLIKANEYANSEATFENMASKMIKVFEKMKNEC